MRNQKKNLPPPLPLPEDLTRDILLRLPVKSLMRFRCVCKSWLSLISDPNFAKSHYDLAASPSHRLLYIKYSDKEARTLDLDASLHDRSATLNLDLPLLKSSHLCLKILGSCRGFILLGKYPNLILWNPITGVHKQLPHSPIVSKFDESIHQFTLMYGFGYDASTDDYLVVIAYKNINYIAHLKFFSVRTNSWKEIEGTHFPYIYAWNQSELLFFNGTIHWLAFRPEYNKSVRVIVAFDLIQKKLSEVSLPDCDLDYFFGGLMIMGGYLSLFYWQRSSDKTEIWVMKEYKVQSSWTKYEIPCSCVFPIYSTKGGELVAYSAPDGQLMKFNDKRQLLECRTDLKQCKIAMYTESLLLLPSGCGEARVDDQQ